MEWSVQVPKNSMGKMVIEKKLVTIDEKIYSFDFDEERLQEDSYLVRVHCLQKDFIEWSRIEYSEDQEDSCLPPACKGYSVVSYGKYAYLWGGYNLYNVEGHNTFMDTLFRFDSELCLWETPEVFGKIPPGRGNHTAAIYNKKMYIIGANDSDAAEVLDVFSLELESLTWRLIRTKTCPAFNPAIYISSPAIYSGDRCIYFGGGNETEVFPELDLICLDLEKRFWSSTSSTKNPPRGKMVESGFIHRDLIYILGGNNEDYQFDCMQRYNKKTNEWKKMDMPIKSGRVDGCLVMGNKVCIFIRGKIPKGTKNPNGAENEICDSVCIADFDFSLQSLSMLKVINLKLKSDELPKCIQEEIKKF